VKKRRINILRPKVKKNKIDRIKSNQSEKKEKKQRKSTFFGTLLMLEPTLTFINR
jgi:hypothetical protein